MDSLKSLSLSLPFVSSQCQCLLVVFSHLLEIFLAIMSDFRLNHRHLEYYVIRLWILCDIRGKGMHCFSRICQAGVKVQIPWPSPVMPQGKRSTSLPQQGKSPYSSDTTFTRRQRDALLLLPHGHHGEGVRAEGSSLPPGRVPLIFYYAFSYMT